MQHYGALLFFLFYGVNLYCSSDNNLIISEWTGARVTKFRAYTDILKLQTRICNICGAFAEGM